MQPARLQSACCRIILTIPPFINSLPRSPCGAGKRRMQFILLRQVWRGGRITCRRFCLPAAPPARPKTLPKRLVSSAAPPCLRPTEPMLPFLPVRRCLSSVIPKPEHCSRGCSNRFPMNPMDGACSATLCSAPARWRRRLPPSPGLPAPIRRLRLTYAAARFWNCSVGLVKRSTLTGRAMQMAPESGEAWLKLGLCLQRLKEVESARTALERAVTLSPASSEAWFALGLIRQDQRDPTAAADAYRRALDIRPELVEATVNLGICYQEIGNLPEAKAFYRLALEIRPDSFGRIAQALSAAPIGEVWLDVAELRRSLAR